MADLTRTIEILFEGTNNVGSTITAVSRDIDSLGGNVSSIAQPFAETTEAIAKLDAALAAMAIGGLAYAFQESSTLQSAFTELKKVAGDSADALDAAKVNAKALSNEYGESAASILSSTANYVQAGYSIEESMQLAKNGMDLVIAGGVDASQSSELVIATLKGFREPASEASRYLDILNEVSNQYATDTEQLGIAMAGISPIARQMGFSMEETAGIVTPVIEIFRSGSEASDALKTGLLKLIDDSKPVGEALASIGVAQEDANGNLRSGKDILYDVAKAFQTLDEDQKLFVTQQLVGIDQSARMVEVFDNLGKSTEITAVAMGAAGSAAKEVAESLKDPEVAINRLVEGFKNLASSIGDSFQDSGTNAINGFTAVLNSLETAADSGAFDALSDALNDFLDGIGDNLRKRAETLPEALDNVDYSGFIDSLSNIKKSISTLFDGIDFGDPESLANAIQKVVDTFESLVDFSSGIADVFVSVAGYISELIDWFNDLDGDTKTFLGNLSGIGSVITTIAVPIGLVADSLRGFGSVLTTTSKLTLELGSGVANLALSFPALFSAVSAGVGGWALGTLLREAIPQVDETAQSIIGFIDKYTGLIGVYDQEQEVKEQSIAVDKRWKEVMEERSEASKKTAEQSLADNLEIVNSIERGQKASESWTDYITNEMSDLGILVTADTKGVEQKFQEIQVWRESLGSWETIKVPIDTTEVEKAKDKIDDSIPAVKRLEIQTELDVAKIKADAETIQSAIEWKAKLDIAEVEANAEIMKSAFDSVGESVKATSDASSSMFSSLADFEGSTSTKWLLEDTLKEQMALQEKALAQQAKLTEAQAEYLKARTDSLKSGKAQFVVDFTGAQPHMEALMWEFLSAIQVRASEEGLGALLLGAS